MLQDRAAARIVRSGSARIDRCSRGDWQCGFAIRGHTCWLHAVPLALRGLRLQFVLSDCSGARLAPIAGCFGRSSQHSPPPLQTGEKRRRGPGRNAAFAECAAALSTSAVAATVRNTTSDDQEIPDCRSTRTRTEKCCPEFLLRMRGCHFATEAHTFYAGPAQGPRNG